MRMREMLDTPGNVYNTWVHSDTRFNEEQKLGLIDESKHNSHL